MSELQEYQKTTLKTPKTVVQSKQQEVMPQTIDLIELGYCLIAKWKLIIGLALAFAMAAGVYVFFVATPMYEAKSTIYVLNRDDSAINLSDLQLGTALTQDYIKVFDIWEVHEEVISNLNLPYTYKEIKEMLRVSNTSNTRMIDITITSPSAAEAAAMANEYANVVRQFIADTMSTTKPNIMSVALVPVNPVSPAKVSSIIKGFLLGIVCCCGCLTLAFVMDDKYKTAEDIRKYTGLINLAVIPVEASKSKKGSRKHA